MSVEHLKAVMDGLCRYYTDREGNPRKLNPTQTAVYTSLLGQFSHEELQGAATRWMAQSAFFPAASDLRKMLVPEADATAQAHLAWAAIEQAIRQAGIYQGATFDNGAVGEAMRQACGSWAQACSFDLDSPGWHARKQTFLTIYPSIAARQIGPVTLRGLHKCTPMRVGAIDGLAAPSAAAGALAEGPLSHDESKKALQGLADRGLVKLGPRRIETTK